jgi:hypothetical protein
VTDIQKNGTRYYGKPLLTVGCVPFGVDTQTILSQFQVSIGSWLRSSAQIVVHLYDVVGGMGSLSSDLVGALQRQFGANRGWVRGKIIKKYRVETVPEALEAITPHAETIFVGWFSNDMIIPCQFIQYLYAARRYFTPFTNYSLHFSRRDMYEGCRRSISLSEVARTDWPAWLQYFRDKCTSRLHSYGCERLDGRSSLLELSGIVIVLMRIDAKTIVFSGHPERWDQNPWQRKPA